MLERFKLHIRKEEDQTPEQPSEELSIATSLSMFKDTWTLILVKPELVMQLD